MSTANLIIKSVKSCNLRTKKYFALCFFLIAFQFCVKAQPSFTMSNLSVSDCRGILTDSENGTPAGNYNHDENLVFKICIPGSDSIVLSFSSFCTESGLDVIKFHDGPDTLSPIIGIPFSGSSLPPVIIARSGCLTIHFISDRSVSCTGWVANWFVNRTVPEPPLIAPISNQNCGVNSISILLSEPILCDSVSIDDIRIIGAGAPVVSAITPLGCVNGTTKNLQVNIAGGIFSNGTFNVILSNNFLDACDSLWQLISYQNFTVSGCPIVAEILSNDTILCLGECTDIIANAWGSTSGIYNYNWSNGLGTGRGPKNVCPITTTTYRVTVTDNINTPAGIAQKTVVVIPKPILPVFDSICQTALDLNFTANPPGGYWKGPGIVDTTSGRFRPNNAGGGTKWIKYNYFQGCVDSFRKYVIPMDAGPVRASCPDANSFNLNGTPAGGVWSGTGITNAANGTFSPIVSGIGSFKIVYAAGSCPSDTTTVNVSPITALPDDTVCRNDASFNFSFSPVGGTWSGSGIINARLGRFNPAAANIGVNNLIYAINGCSDTVVITVNDIWGGWDISACPTQSPFPLFEGVPLGGYWTGAGVDSITGFFNPDYLNGVEANSRAYYNANGCVDEIIIYNNITNIINDTVGKFCPYDDAIVLNWETVRNYPWGGSWSGSGVFGVDSFAPNQSIYGWHKLYYTVNGCTDSTLVKVFTDPKLEDTTVCIAQSPFEINNSLNGGNWYGNGIVNQLDGIFSPQNAGIGIHNLYYVSADNCGFPMQVTVDTMPILQLSGLPSSFCFKDTNFIVIPNYPNGIWSGASTNGIFNPSQNAYGSNSINYSLGNGQCRVSATASIYISEPLSVNTWFQDSLLCNDAIIRIGGTGFGGDNINYSFAWSDSIGNGTSALIYPDASKTYTVTLTDGCSAPATDTVRVRLLPELSISLETDGIKCYEEPSFVRATVFPAGNYDLSWSHDNSLNTNFITALAGRFYRVKATETASGCFIEADTLTPSYGKLYASFFTTPADECVSTLNPDVQIIDQSEGGISGFWDYGDFTKLPYGDDNALLHAFKKVGKYTITLTIQNNGGCMASTSQEVCVTQSTRLIAPTAFSPNGDGINDVFRIKVLGVEQFNLKIYNRWGELVFTAKDETEGWDGTFKNVNQGIGTYIYTLDYFNLEENKNESMKGTVTIIR